MPLYMRIEGLDPEGVGDTEDIGGRSGWFAIGEMSKAVSRDISVSVGSAANSDSGQTFMSPISVSRNADGATPYLMTYLHKPGPEGFTVNIVSTKPDREGDGQVVTCLWTLTHSRISSHSLHMTEAGATESITFVYTMDRYEDWYENEKGEIVRGQTVEFDLSKAKLTSAAKS